MFLFLLRNRENLVHVWDDDLHEVYSLLNNKIKFMEMSPWIWSLAKINEAADATSDNKANPAQLQVLLPWRVCLFVCKKVFICFSDWLWTHCIGYAKFKLTVSVPSPEWILVSGPQQTLNPTIKK